MWPFNMLSAVLQIVLVKQTGLPTTGDFWMKLPDGDYVQWDMVTGQVITHSAVEGY